MKSIDTHGIRMRGLKAASGATKDYGHYDGQYVQVFYDTQEHEVFTRHHVSHNSYCAYDNGILFVARTYNHLTMQRIADLVCNALEHPGAPRGEWV